MESRAGIARRLVATYGGRFSLQLGIDVDRGGREVDRWFLAATLFGNRISSRIAMRTYRILAGAGIETIHDVRERSWDDLVALLDQGGYARYDYRMASRLQALEATLARSWANGAGALLADACARHVPPRDLLDELPGWGPTTVDLFLREIERGARPMDSRAHEAAAHLGLGVTGPRSRPVRPCDLAARAAVDERDLEAALVRLWLVHRRHAPECVGGRGCVALASGSAETAELALHA